MIAHEIMERLDPLTVKADARTMDRDQDRTSNVWSQGSRRISRTLTSPTSRQRTGRWAVPSRRCKALPLRRLVEERDQAYEQAIQIINPYLTNLTRADDRGRDEGSADERGSSISYKSSAAANDDFGEDVLLGSAQEAVRFPPARRQFHRLMQRAALHHRQSPACHPRPSVTVGAVLVRPTLIVPLRKRCSLTR